MLSAWEGLYDGQTRRRRHSRSRARPRQAAHDRTVVSCWATTTTWRSGTSEAATLTGPLADALGHGTQGHERVGRLPQPEGTRHRRRGLSQRGARRRHRRGPMAARDLRRAAAPPAPRPAIRSPASPRRAASRCRCSPGDRRAALRSLWSPFLPDARWDTEHPARAGSAHVYLDVSGSMDAEMPLIVALLGRLRRLHPPALLGVQQRRRARAHRAGPAHRRHHRRHQHGAACSSTWRARRPRAAHCRHRRLHRTAQPAPGGVPPAGTRLHVIVTRDGNAAPAAARRSALHAVIEVAIMIRMSEVVSAGSPGQVLRPGRRRDRRRVLQGRSREPTARSR